MPTLAVFQLYHGARKTKNGWQYLVKIKENGNFSFLWKSGIYYTQKNCGLKKRLSKREAMFF